MSETQIHPSAIIEDGAQIGAGARIGPFCCISAEAEIGERAELLNNVTVLGATKIGAGSVVYPYAVLGGPPQIVNYQDADTSLQIGENCTIREHVVMHRGSTRDEGVTRIGPDCLFMDSAHVGHDCELGKGCVMARGATLGGHAIIEDGVYIGGLSAVHQFTRIGRKAFIGGLVPVTRDIIPYAIVNGSPSRLEGLNIVGLKRMKFQTEQIRDMLTAFDLMFRGADATFKERVAEVSQTFAESAEVREIVSFIQAPSKRGLCTLV